MSRSGESNPNVVTDPEESRALLWRELRSGTEGLSAVEAARRLKQFGPNEIVRRTTVSRPKQLLAQLVHPLALLLWVAAVLALLGNLPSLSLAIVAVILLNALFAFFQEIQAERATEALRRYLPERALVRRDGSAGEVDVTEVVPGDVLVIEEGQRLCADARLLEGSVEVDASPLTGESQAVTRSATEKPSTEAHSRLDAPDLVFSGTLCTGGEATGVIFATGMATELGRIASLTAEVEPETSPLQLQINRAARLIAAIAVGIGVIFLFAGTVFAGLPLTDGIVFAIGLIVANVPEGLLPTITLALAVAVRRMAKRRALVKRLTAVETLGSTDVICTDKTGTLTEGRMSVASIWVDGAEVDPDSGRSPQTDGDPFGKLLEAALSCNRARISSTPEGWEREGDPVESALLITCNRFGLTRAREEPEERVDEVRILRFDPRLKRMSTIDRSDSGRLILNCKGAPSELLELCTSRLGPEGSEALDEQARREIAEAFDDYARRGLRVLGFARREILEGQMEGDREALESDLTFLGLVALEDPPREEVREAVALCRRAGVSVLVVTGDHGLTAEAVARQVGIVEDGARIVSGTEVEEMSAGELSELLADPEGLIVARSNPETKLRLVDALRERGHTVAMTGDGVNDAPALRRANIGVAMGASGTEVAREAATMVLTDDNFASITAAIEEGRVVYENVKKFVTYIFAHSTPEMVPLLFFALSGGAIPLPLTALQILAIDLGTETLPALALGREPAEPGIVDRPPRKSSERIVDRPLLMRAWVWLGLVEAALVMVGFLFVLLQAGWSPGDPVGAGSVLHEDYLKATGMTFAGITACQVGTAFAARTTRASLWQIGPFSNRLLLGGIAFELLFAAAVIYLPPLQSVFQTRPLGWQEILLLATFPAIVWGSDEFRRWVLRWRESRRVGMSAASQN